MEKDVLCNDATSPGEASITRHGELSIKVKEALHDAITQV